MLKLSICVNPSEFYLDIDINAKNFSSLIVWTLIPCVVIPPEKPVFKLLRQFFPVSFETIFRAQFHPSNIHFKLPFKSSLYDYSVMTSVFFIYSLLRLCIDLPAFRWVGPTYTTAALLPFSIRKFPNNFLSWESFWKPLTSILGVIMLRSEIMRSGSKRIKLCFPHRYHVEPWLDAICSILVAFPWTLSICDLALHSFYSFSPMSKLRGLTWGLRLIEIFWILCLQKWRQYFNGDTISSDNLWDWFLIPWTRVSIYFRFGFGNMTMHAITGLRKSSRKYILS